MLGGETWVLLDRSPSMGAEPPLEQWLDANEVDLATWRNAVAKKRVLSFPHPKGFETDDLAEALRLMRPKLKVGDHLIVRTDGRILGDLPDPMTWKGIHITAVPPAAQPRFQQVIGPAAWPSTSAAAIWLRIRLQDADLPNGDLQVRDRSGQVSDLSLQNHGDGWLALQLRCEAPPVEALDLTLRWIESSGEARTVLRIAPPGTMTPNWISPDQPAQETLRRLHQGEILFLADPGVQTWQSLPQDLAIFEAQEEEVERPLWVLLDVSGSMEGQALQEGLAALSDLVKHWRLGPIQVVPFQQDLLDTISLRSAADLPKLEKLSAFGPTDLAQALHAMGSRIQGPEALLVISDGAAGQPDLDWALLLQEHLAETQVFCLPTGPNAEWDFLDGLGEVLRQGEWSQRLDGVLTGLQEAPLVPVYPVAGGAFPLPETWQPLEEHPAWQAAAGAEVLLKDAQDRAYLAIRRMGPGLLVGFADRPDAKLDGLARQVEQAFRSPSRDGWVGSRFFVQSGEAPPVIRQGARDLEVRMFDVGPPVRWEGLDASPLMTTTVDGLGIPSWQAGPLTRPEWGNPRDPWNRWLEIQRNGLTGSVFRPRLLWAGVLLLTTAFVLRTLRTR